MQEMVNGVLKQLGRDNFDWDGVTEWEARLLKRLFREVEGVPTFVVTMLDHFLDRQHQLGQRHQEHQRERDLHSQ